MSNEEFYMKGDVFRQQGRGRERNFFDFALSLPLSLPAGNSSEQGGEGNLATRKELW